MNPKLQNSEKKALLLFITNKRFRQRHSLQYLLFMIVVVHWNYNPKHLGPNVPYVVFSSVSKKPQQDALTQPRKQFDTTKKIKQVTFDVSFFGLPLVCLVCWFPSSSLTTCHFCSLFGCPNFFNLHKLHIVCETSLMTTGKSMGFISM